jgi:hypothetical protein
MYSTTVLSGRKEGVVWVEDFLGENTKELPGQAATCVDSLFVAERNVKPATCLVGISKARHESRCVQDRHASLTGYLDQLGRDDGPFIILEKRTRRMCPHKVIAVFAAP